MLDGFGIVGVSFRQVGSEALADYALAECGRNERLREFAQSNGIGELAYLETCNRVEAIFTRDGNADLRADLFHLLAGRQAAPGEAERVLNAWHGEGAVEHLFLVAAGLDSAALGEPEIVGQVRQCRDAASGAGLIGPGLSRLFEEALRVAAAVRDQTRLAEGSISLAELAVGHVLGHGRDGGPEASARLPTALVGVSPMTERAALSLAKAGRPFLVVNRTAAKAKELASRFNMPHASLEAFRRSPPALAAILSATGAREPVIDGEALRRLAGHRMPPICVDMGVPPDIDPVACRKADLRRVGMDDIVREAECNRENRLKQAADARELVDAALIEFRQQVTYRLHGPLFANLQAHYQALAESGTERFLKRFKHLEAEDRAAIKAWSAAQARRYAHLPTAGLRSLLLHGPDGALDAFLAGLDADVAASLRRRPDGLGGDDGSTA